MRRLLSIGPHARLHSGQSLELQNLRFWLEGNNFIASNKVISGAKVLQSIWVRTVGD